MRLRDKIHIVLETHRVPDENFYLSRAIAEAISTQPAVGFKGTFRRDRKQPKIRKGTTDVSRTTPLPDRG